MSLRQIIGGFLLGHPHYRRGIFNVILVFGMQRPLHIKHSFINILSLFLFSMNQLFSTLIISNVELVAELSWWRQNKI